MNHCRCGESIHPGRIRLGMKNCLKCGEVEAKKEIEAKKLRVAPDFNKGGYAYQGSPEDALERMRNGAGKKNEVAATSFNYVAPPKPVAPPDLTEAINRKLAKVRRRVIGVYYIGQEGYFWYEGDDPKKKGATRWARIRD